MIIILIIVLTYVAVVIGLCVQASYYNLPAKMPPKMMIMLPLVMVVMVVRFAIDTKQICALSLLLQFQELCTVTLCLFADALIQTKAAATTKKEKTPKVVNQNAFNQGKDKLGHAIACMVS